MPKLTLLDMTQRVLSSIEGDPVNGFADTDESEEVAYIIRDAYYDMVTNHNIPEHEGLITLTALADVTQPSTMQVPTAVSRIETVWYNKVDAGDTARDYQMVPYVEPSAFLSRTLGRNSDDSDVEIVSAGDGEVLIHNDKQPDFYTSFDDDYMIFDSFNSAVDSTLQASKFMVYGTTEPTFTMSDTFTPDLDVSLFPLLLSEAKSIAAIQLNQQANPKTEQTSRRHRSRWQSNRHKVEQSNNNNYGRPDYGRKSRR